MNYNVKDQPHQPFEKLRSLDPLAAEGPNDDDVKLLKNVEIHFPKFRND